MEKEEEGRSFKEELAFEGSRADMDGDAGGRRYSSVDDRLAGFHTDDDFNSKNVAACDTVWCMCTHDIFARPVAFAGLYKLA